MFMGRGATVGSPALMQAQGAQAKPHGGSCPVPLSTLPKALASQGTLPRAWRGGWRPAEQPKVAGGLALLSCHLSLGVECMGGSWTASPPMDTEGLDLFLRQSCILILDVFPEAYFS